LIAPWPGYVTTLDLIAASGPRQHQLADRQVRGELSRACRSHPPLSVPTRVARWYPTAPPGNRKFPPAAWKLTISAFQDAASPSSFRALLSCLPSFAFGQ